MFSDEHKADADMLAAQLEAKVSDLETCRRDRTQLTRENSDLRTRLQRAEELLHRSKGPLESSGYVDLGQEIYAFVDTGRGGNE